MSTPDLNPCSAPLASDGPQSPFLSLNYHFGMLLGVSDFDTEQSYHRGKVWLHNAWLHREGVVWGFGVAADLETGEIRVAPGLALDARGRELHLEGDACLNVAAWFAAHRNDAGFTFDENDQRILFDAHVAIRFKACLTRQVPALVEPCEGANTATAYSRVFETLEILLRPGLAPERPRPYHRLRLFFGLDEPAMEEGSITPADQEVLDAPKTLASFRRFAALDEIDLRPPDADEDLAVPLADITGITLSKSGDQLTLTAAAVNPAVRPSHVATAAIQELLCGRPGGAGGPVAYPASFVLDETGNTIRVGVDRDLAPASVHPQAFSLSVFDETAGWNTPAISSATYFGATRTIELAYAGPLSGTLVRLIVRGSGPTPVLGANLAPLGNGTDFVHVHRRS